MFRHLLIGLLAVAMLLMGCGAGGGGGGGGGDGGGNTAPVTGDVSTLTGTWFGTMEDDLARLGTMTVTVSATGAFTFHETITPSSGSGTIAPVAGYTNIFGTDTHGGLIVDPAAAHLGFVDTQFNFGALQKGAAVLPTFGPTDINGSWSGTGVYAASVNWTLEQVFPVSATIVATQSSATITGSDAHGAFSGSFSTYNTAYGRYTGTITQGGVSSYLGTFLTADKQFAAYYGCKNGGYVPDDCSFGFANKH